MPTGKELQDQEVRERLARFEAERAAVRRRQKIGYTVIAIVSSIVLLTVTGDPLGVLGLLGFRGIRNEERGVYADCSKGANMNLAACRPKISAADRDWKELTRNQGKPAPFTLYGDDE